MESEKREKNLLEIRNVCKEFPGVVAVNDVSFDIKKGEVHIIVGENGAGKSTLVKMVAGIYSIDSGAFVLDGEEYRPKNVLDAQNKGVNIVHQELSLMDHRTVAQNMFVGREPVGKFLKLVDSNKMNAECRRHLESLELTNIDPSMPVMDLSIAQQQMVEVAKALTTDNKLLIMDEPTSSLTHKEIDSLFVITRKLKNEGVGIVYISHRLQELMEIGDRITIMRDGEYIGTYDLKNISMDEIIAKMVGRKIENVYNRAYNAPGDTLISTHNLKGLRFRNVNIHLKAGEIVGLAGLVGAGRTELAKAMFGCDRIEDGYIDLFGKGKKITKIETKQAVQASISFLPEDRKAEGLVLRMPVDKNIVMAHLPKLPKVSLPGLPKVGFVSMKKNRPIVEKAVSDLDIRTTSIKKSVANLSGGNQQKVVLAKWLLTQSRIFLFDEPTRGIDVGAKSEIYSVMNELTRGGAAILMISSDLPELMGMADRIYIMKDGEISGEVERTSDNFTQEFILDLAIKG